ncbi:MAG: hypothetical protein KAG70_15205, partial [Alcanivorax sp.]|nr:hypothetical protein [Alcanivorax sp.]
QERGISRRLPLSGQGCGYLDPLPDCQFNAVCLIFFFPTGRSRPQYGLPVIVVPGVCSVCKDAAGLPLFQWQSAAETNSTARHHQEES